MGDGLEEWPLDLRTPDQPSALRRLTNRELTRVYQALVGFVPRALATMPLDRTDHQFAAVVQSQAISDAHLDSFLAIAEEVASALVPSRVGEWSPLCQAVGTLDGPAERRCAQDFSERFAARAFRRPAPPETVAAALALYDEAADFAEGMRQIVRHVLLSPETNYLIEGAADELDDYGRASRLSFAICRMPPDDELLSEAAAGRLSAQENFTAMARRLWQSPCAREAVTEFFVEWLGVEKVLSAVRSQDDFPGYDGALAQAMLDETRLFVEHLVFDQEAGVKTLLHADHSYVNETLASLYGVDVRGSQHQRVQMPGERRGVLTHASLLTATAGEHGTSPVKRGLFVLRRLLCADIPPPPQNVPLPTPSPGEERSPRELWERHVADPNCSGCHRFIDPVGFAFEEFDEIGRFRTVDRQGHPVDARGGLPLLDIPVGELRGVGALAEQLAQTKQLPLCLARHWLRNVAGRLEEPADGDSLMVVARALDDGQSVAEALLTLFGTEAFSRGKVVSQP